MIAIFNVMVALAFLPSTMWPVPPAKLQNSFGAIPESTYAEELRDAEIVELGKFVGRFKVEGKWRTDFQVVRVANGCDTQVVGSIRSLPGRRSGMQGDQFLITGRRHQRTEQIQWRVVRCSDVAFEYAVKSPSSERPIDQRLKYHLEFLEARDPFVAQDAYAVFMRCAVSDYRTISEHFRKERLLKWTLSNSVEPRRRGLYGVLLGMCGDEAVAVRLRTRLFAQNSELRPGIHAVATALLMLTGDRHLDEIDERSLRSDTDFTEIYASMQAVRFMWQHGQDKISAPRLQQSVRNLLHRPIIADLAISELARMEDWSCVDRIASLYGKEEFNIPGIQRAVIRYLAICAHEAKADVDKSRLTKEVSVPAAAHLAAIQERDPQRYQEVKRFLILHEEE